MILSPAEQTLVLDYYDQCIMGDMKHVFDVFLYRYVLFVIQNQLGQGYTLQASVLLKNFKSLPVVTATMAVETPLYDNNMFNFQKTSL